MENYRPELDRFKNFRKSSDAANDERHGISAQRKKHAFAALAAIGALAAGTGEAFGNDNNPSGSVTLSHSVEPSTGNLSHGLRVSVNLPPVTESKVVDPPSVQISATLLGREDLVQKFQISEGFNAPLSDAVNLSAGFSLGVAHTFSNFTDADKRSYRLGLYGTANLAASFSIPVSNNTKAVVTPYMSWKAAYSPNIHPTDVGNSGINVQPAGGLDVALALPKFTVGAGVDVYPGSTKTGDVKTTWGENLHVIIPF